MDGNSDVYSQCVVQNTLDSGGGGINSMLITISNRKDNTIIRKLGARHKHRSQQGNATLFSSKTSAPSSRFRRADRAESKRRGH